MAGSRGFALSTSPADGMFYLGQAEGLGEFVKFSASLNLPRTGKAIPARSLLPELQRLQDKVNAAFVPPKSIDQHPRFIALNATLKTALELDAGKFYRGALYQYLDAVRSFGVLDTAELDAGQKSELKIRSRRCALGYGRPRMIPSSKSSPSARSPWSAPRRLPTIGGVHPSSAVRSCRLAWRPASPRP